jgi:poly(3-hydroxybutyrate) depolymerase
LVHGGSGGTTVRSTGGSGGSGGGGDSGNGASASATTGGRSSGGTGGRLTATGGQVGTGGASATGGSGTAATGGTSKSAGCGSAEGLKSGRATIDVSGSAREYILKMPAGYDGTKPYILIFGFHARGGNASQVAGSGNDNYYGLAARAGDKAIFVAPEGLDAGWRNSDGRDIVFVKAMLAFFNSKLCVDQQRIFSTGFSFGGMMSDAIGCAMADVFRAIAPMAGGLPTADHPYSGCDQVNDHPIAVWMSHGDSDTTVAFADGKAARDLFVKRNQCQTQTSSVTPSPCVAYQGCLAGYPVHWCQFSGGHAVPDFASKAIWDFFSQF